MSLHQTYQVYSILVVLVLLLHSNLPPGHRAQFGRSKDSLCRWGYIEDSVLSCICSAIPQIMMYLISSPAYPDTCTQEELIVATDSAIRIANFWSDTD